MFRKIKLLVRDIIKLSGGYGLMFYATLIYLPLSVSSSSIIVSLLLMGVYLGVVLWCLYWEKDDM